MITCLHFSVVMSSWCVITLDIDLIGAKSMPIITLDNAMWVAATWSQPPGAAHKSTHIREFSRKW